MYGKYKRRSSRAGFQKIKLICSINVTQLVIANSSSIQPGSVLSICFEKGGKISTSNEIIFDTNKNDINPLRTNVNMKHVAIPIDERVELVMTMYKDVSNSKFQEKIAKLILRQLKRHSGLGMDAFKGIGACELRLHELVQEVETSRSTTKECTLPLENLPGCSMSALISIKFLKTRSSLFGMRNSIGGMSTSGHVGEEGDSADDGEDNVSVGSTVSGGSAFSTLGATFYYNDLEEYYGAGEGIVGLSGAVQTGISDSYTFGKSRSGDSDHDPENANTSTSMHSVAGAPRRRSGVHVVEAAHQAERKPIKPLSRRPSNIGAGSRSSMAPFGSTSSLLDANQSDADFMATARSPPSSPVPIEQTTSHAHAHSHGSPPLRSETHTRTSRSPSVAIPTRAGVEGDWADDVNTGNNQAEWESVTTTERDRTSTHGSPVKLSSPKSVHGRKNSNASSPGIHNGHVLLTASAASSLGAGSASASVSAAPSAHTSYNNQETFALLEKELQARGERIALLEARLAQQEQDHRAELLAVRSELNAAQAEVRLLSAVPEPPPPPPPTALPAVVVSVSVGVQSEPLPPLSVMEPEPSVISVDQETSTVPTNDEEPVEEVGLPFVCSRCQRSEEESSAEEDQKKDKEEKIQAEKEADKGEVEVEEVITTTTEASAENQQPELQAPLATQETQPQKEEELKQPSNQEKEQEQVQEPVIVLSQGPQPAQDRETLTESATETQEEEVPGNAPNELPVLPVEAVRELSSHETVIPAERVKRSAILRVDSGNDPIPEISVASITISTSTVSTATETLPEPASEPIQIPAPVPVETASIATETETERAPSREAPPAAIAALLSEYGRSSAQVQLLAQDLVYYKQAAEDALRAKAEETLASREAATVAVHACMRRADCEQELEEAVYQLRELQRKHARLTIEYEAEVRRNYSLKARLQLYAQKLSAMEVDYTLSLEETSGAEEMS